jgi:hypothetical protein
MSGCVVLAASYVFLYIVFTKENLFSVSNWSPSYWPRKSPRNFIISYKHLCDIYSNFIHVNKRGNGVRSDVPFVIQQWIVEKGKTKQHEKYCSLFEGLENYELTKIGLMTFV